jgi:hypothetical protein
LFSGKVILNRWHKEVGTTFGDVAHDIELKVAAARRDGRLAELAVDIFNSACQARYMFVSREVLVVKKYFLSGVKRVALDALVLAEPVKQALDGQRADAKDCLIIAGVAFRKSSAGATHVNIKLLRKELFDIVRLSEHEGWERQVAERVLELGDIVEALSVLIDFVTDNTGDHGSGGGNGWDNLASNHLRLIAIGLSDLVVAGAQVRASRNEIDMEVGVIILFKVSRLE